MSGDHGGCLLHLGREGGGGEAGLIDQVGRGEL
ncbi:uncharacterized protein METZ01_LOCUS496430, partial [marine metagenome]